MERDKSFIAELQRLFSEKSDICLSSKSNPKLLVFENNQNQSQLESFTEDIVGFTITNPNSKPIHLLAIDQCLLIHPNEGKRCDCVVFDDTSLCFIELKLDVSKSRASKGLKEARQQLKETIKFFNTQFSSESSAFRVFQLEAYAVVKTEVYPKFRANRQIVFERFLKDTGVRLFEKNKRTFK